MFCLAPVLLSARKQADRITLDFTVAKLNLQSVRTKSAANVINILGVKMNKRTQLVNFCTFG